MENIGREMIQFFIALFILQMLDVATTMYGLSLGIQEQNPAMVDIVSQPILFLGIKLAVIPIFAWIALSGLKDFPKVAMAMKLYSIGFMSFVVIANTYNIITW